MIAPTDGLEAFREEVCVLRETLKRTLPDGSRRLLISVTRMELEILRYLVARAVEEADGG